MRIDIFFNLNYQGIVFFKSDFLLICISRPIKLRLIFFSDSNIGNYRTNHLMQNLTETELTLKSTADSLGLNKSYLATLFKKETGATFTSYVNQKRLDHAIFLLNATDMQIQEIASSCGIPDVTYFTRLFKQEKGMTPTQYKKMLGQK